MRNFGVECFTVYTFIICITIIMPFVNYSIQSIKKYFQLPENIFSLYTYAHTRMHGCTWELKNKYNKNQQ